MEKDLEKATRIVAIIGPESTGKTTLALEMGKQLGAPVVAEYARDYLTVHRGSYTQQDLSLIAKGQFDTEQHLLNEGHPLIICDTDLTVIKIWSDAKYGSTATDIITLLTLQPDRFVLLMKPDLPWEPDALRENPDDRDELFDRYVAFLDESGASYAVVGGEGEERMNNAMKAITKHIPIKPQTASSDGRGACE